jgi:diguanylate cyclase (GGDEF)-like protein
MDYLHLQGSSVIGIIEEYLYNITRSSVTDGLTGLYNQTYFKRFWKPFITRDVTAIMPLRWSLDLDHFKQYNDRCGHLLGDEALRLCAR